jgi:hypothetical protein
MHNSFAYHSNLHRRDVKFSSHRHRQLSYDNHHYRLMHSLHYTTADDVRKEILHDFPSCHLLYRDFESNHHNRLCLHTTMMTSCFCHCCSAHAPMGFYYCRDDVGDDDEADRYGYNDEAVVADVLVDPQLSMGNFVSDISHLLLGAI